MWRASVLTIFPDMFPGALGMSLAGKALAAGTWSLDVTDIRAHATDKHRTVDDTPAGGGPGMVMKAEVLARAVDAACSADDTRPRQRQARHRRRHAGRRRARHGDEGRRAGPRARRGAA